MKSNDIKCVSCWNEFEWKHSHTSLWFKKYECIECKQNFITELTTWYKIFYWLLLLLLLWTWISTVVDWWFPIVRGIFIILIGLVLFKDFNLKKIGWENIKRTGKKGFIIFGVFISLVVLSFVMQWNPIEFNEDQKKYIWNWKWDWITLIISDNAYIDYKKQKNSVSTSISGPITEFNDNNFKASILFINSTFNIDKKPFQEWNLWKMTVDWNELSRVTNSYELIIPELWELNKLTNDFFTLFNNSVYKGDYQSFYDWISKAWQSQTSVEDLKNAISPILVYGINVEDIISNEIVYSKPPFLSQNNLLVIEWYYVGDIKLAFSLNFIYEYPNWKLIWFKF